MDKATALKKLQRYCAYQDRCHREVRSKLLRLGVRGATLEEVMVELIEEGFLDEERFARSFARGKWRFKGWGRRRIVRELQARDLSEYCIRKALEEIDEAEYLPGLVRLLERKAGAIGNCPLPELRKRLRNFALRRGYEPEVISQALEQAQLPPSAGSGG
ncbi:MAG: RecX family transcriptional regulator [Bacteroidetes bacterium]|nr:MAG: RecX family transcriptional regulator [Bacteroidota bacterium]